MGALSTGMMQSWLTVPTVVLSQIFTLLFIGLIGRVVRRKDESSQIDRPEFAAPEEVFSLLLNAGGQWQTRRTEALFGEAEPPQCVADRFPDLGAAGVGLHKARDGKAGFQFEPPLSGYFGLLDAA